MPDNIPYSLFVAAMQLVEQQFFYKAAPQFLEIVELYPDHELADDALYNAGLCYFHMNLFDKAIDIFRELVNTYPNATVYQDKDAHEFGRTAAKAHYALINCYLGLNNVDKAQEELTLLNGFDDSYLLSAMNETVSYKELAQKAINTFTQFK